MATYSSVHGAKMYSFAAAQFAMTVGGRLVCMQ
jgi:hypothetical protein